MDILVVEDDVLQGLWLEGELRAVGFGVILVGSIDAARRILAEKSPALAIIDLVLSDSAGRDGVALARAIDARGIPVVIHSGLQDPALGDLLGGFEPAAVIGKPAPVAEIVETVGALCPPAT